VCLCHTSFVRCSLKFPHHHPAPQAFIALLEALGTTLPALVANAPLLTAVLQYHVLPGTVIANTTALAAAGRMRTLLTGKNLTLSGT
jgi:uncharacterized surface protein with fasciclin (FAS1) repeats